MGIIRPAGFQFSHPLSAENFALLLDTGNDEPPHSYVTKIAEKG